MQLSGSTIHFPFRSGVTGSLVTTATRDEIIKQSIADIIETRRGERPMMPDYGIDDFVFAVQNFSFGARLAHHIEQQVKKYVPQIKTIAVTVETGADGRAEAQVRFTEVGRIDAPGNLVFPIWRLEE